MTGNLPAWHAYFDGDPTGFQFTIPGYALSGPTVERFDTVTRQWMVTYTSGPATWHGRGDDRVAAYLDLVACRVNVDVFAQPRRDDKVAAWIKRARDRYDRNGATTLRWNALNDLLDDYRDHADVGQPLDNDTPIGPHAPGEQ